MDAINLGGYVTGNKMMELLGLRGNATTETALRYGIRMLNLDGLNVFSRSDIERVIKNCSSNTELAEKITEAVLKVLEEAGLTKSKAHRKPRDKRCKYIGEIALYTVYKHSGLASSVRWTDFRMAVMSSGVELVNHKKNPYIKEAEEGTIISLIKEHFCKKEQLKLFDK